MTRSDLAAGVVRGNAPERRPESRESGAVRRIAHRTGDVVAMGERRDAGGHRRRRAAARSARRHGARPRAVRAPAIIVHRVQPEAERRGIGAADDDRAGFFPVGDHRAVRGGNDVLERRDAIDRRAAFLVDVFLDRHRDAVQRSQSRAIRNRGVGAIGRGQRLAGEIAGHGIQLRVDRPHPPHACVHGLARRNRTRADAFGERNGIPLPQFVGHVEILVPDARADTRTRSDLPFICHAAR